MTVYVTGATKEIIRQNFIGKLARYYDNNRPKASTELGDRIYDFVIGSDAALLANVPTQYLHMVPSITLSVKAKPPEEFPWVNNKIDIIIPFSESKPWVRTLKSGYVINDKLESTSYFDAKFLIKNEELWNPDIYNSINAIAQRTQANRDIVDKTVLELRELLDQNRTLRQLIKAFPPIKAFVPSEILRELDAEPRARVGKYEGVDREFLTGMAAMARMVE